MFALLLDTTLFKKTLFLNKRILTARVNLKEIHNLKENQKMKEK